MRSESNMMRLAAIAAASFTVLAGLAACEEKPYALPVRQAEAPAPRTTDLAGAPSVTADAPTAAPAYSAPPETAAPAYAPPASRPAYDAGEPQIVAMAPIPNPVDAAPTAAPVRRSRHVDSWTVASAAPAHRTTHKVWLGPTHTARSPVAHPTQPVAAHPARTYAQAAPAPHARVVHPAQSVAVAQPATIHAAPPHVAAAPRTVAANAVAPKPKAVAKAAPTASRSGVVIVDKSADPTKVAALQSSLTDAVSKGAVLTLPAKFDPGQPADVSLTLPADFADTVRKQALGQGLANAAQTVNLNAALAGEGFTITPADSQAQPLVLGQATEFHWSATVKPGTRGPLHADVGADLLGGGDTALQLGSVQQKMGGLPQVSSQSIGVGLLVLIVILVLAFLARGGSSTAPRRQATVGDRPLDMTRPNEHHLDRG